MKNPDFEIEQIESYIDYLDRSPDNLAPVIESNFFPMLQRIFFFRAFEVRKDALFEERKYPFDCIDVLGGRRRILIHFAYTRAKAAVMPGFAINWAAPPADRDRPQLLIIQNRPYDPSIAKVADAVAHCVSTLDFAGLKHFAREGFEAHKSRTQTAAVRIIMEMMERLAVEIGRQTVALHELEWRDVERLLGTVLSGLGYRCITTPPARDGGRDLLVCEITRDDVAWYNIEIKHWLDRQVDQRSVRHCLEVALREGRRGALLLATGGVGDAALMARTEIYRDYLRLGAEAKIVATCRHFVSRQKGLWIEQRPFRKLLFEETV